MSARANFTSITAELTGSSLDSTINPGADVYINLGDGSFPSTDYHPGLVNWKTVGSTILGPSGTPFTTFCIELTQDITWGKSYTYNVVDLASAPTPGSKANGNGSGMGTAKATAIGELWALDYGSIVAATDPTTRDNNAAAFQLAVWKIEYDWGSSLDFTKDIFSQGNFRASEASSSYSTNAAITQAQTWLDVFWNNDSYVTPASGLVALDNPNIQDQLMQLPVPPTLYLAAIGAVALSLRGYRRSSLEMVRIQS